MQLVRSRPQREPLQLPWRSMLAAHVLFLVWAALGSDSLLTAVGVSSIVLLLFCWFAKANGLVFQMLMPISFVATNVFEFGYMNAAYVSIADAPPGIYYDVTAWLGALLAAGTAVGACAMHAFIGRDRIADSVTPLVQTWQALVVSGAAFFAIAGGLAMTGYLDGRWDASGLAAEGNGLGYFVRGLGNLGYLFFFVLGTRLKNPLMTVENLLILAGVCLVALLQALSGGRAASVFIVMALLAGAVWGPMARRSLMTLVAVAVFAGTVFLVVVGEARGKAEFAFGSTSDRVAAMQDSLEETTVVEQSGARPIDVLLGRLYDITAQVVIDQTILTEHYAGFENFDRLAYLFIPRVIATSKGVLSDGKEILQRDFGFVFGPNHAVPLTVLADAFRRGGAPWVAVVGFMAGAMFRLLSRLTVFIVGPDFAVACIALFTVGFLGIYGESVLGFVSAITYHWLKYAVLFAAIAALTRLLAFLTTPAESPRIAPSLQ